MKYWGITYGKFVEGFAVFPSIDVSWISYYDNHVLKRCYDIRFGWLWWYFTIGEIHKKK